MSHNRNPGGHNQHQDVPKADDEDLVAALHKYHREGLTNNSFIAQRLAADHNIIMHSSTVKRRRKTLGLSGSKVTTNTMPHQEKVQRIVDEMDKDPTKGRGLNNIKQRLAFNQGVHLTRDFISQVMHTQDEDGFRLREPNSKQITRVKKNPTAINNRWAGDGHDKLYSIGFAIWAVVDDASAKWLGGWVLPTNRVGYVIAYVYLSLVEKCGGMPHQFSTDCGSETTQVFAFGNALRTIFHLDIDHHELPAHTYMRSIHNISIERSWLRLRLDFGNNAVEIFKKGMDDGIYNPNDKTQYDLCQWLWSNLLQQELDEFMEFRNGTKMRRDRTKAGPSSCSRNDVYSLPGEFGLKNDLLAIDPEVVRDIKKAMGGDDLLRFVPRELSEHFEALYSTLHVEKLTMEIVWVVFQRLLLLV